MQFIIINMTSANVIQLFNSLNYSGATSDIEPNATPAVSLKAVNAQVASFPTFASQLFLEFQATAFTGTVLVQGASVLSTPSNIVWVYLLTLSAPSTSLFWKQGLQTLTQYDVIRVILRSATLATNLNIWLGTGLSGLQPNTQALNIDPYPA